MNRRTFNAIAAATPAELAIMPAALLSAALFVAILAFGCLSAASQDAATPRTAQAPPTSSQTFAATPPMGWNSWNFFADHVTDKDIRNAADGLVSSGMKDAGYIYVNIDDTWQGERDANGVMRSNARFPGMKALADYVHSKGLKFGIYSSPGPKTCGGYEGSLGHEAQDAQLYAAWGIDYLKYDLCSYAPAVMEKQAPNDRAEQMRLMQGAYMKMHQELKATGRPIVYSLCQNGWDAVWEWGPSVGANLWRNTRDIHANWNSIYTLLEAQAGLVNYAGPGHWNDPDILEVGNGDLTLAESRTHFSMWAMLAAPLLAGNDLHNMTPEIRNILTNRDVIAVDQDRLGHEATRAYSEGEVEVWTRPLSGGAMAIALMNAGPDRYSTHPFYLSLTKLGLHGPQKGKDLWSGKEIKLTDNMPIEIANRDILLVRIASPK
jgi:alpha-galactosidase